MILNLGCGQSPIMGAVNLDHRPAPGVDVCAGADRLPFPSNCFTAVLASHVLEHMRNLPQAIEEIYRMLKPGGLLAAWVPYGFWSLANPYHTRVFNKLTLKVLTEAGSPDLDRNRVNWHLVSARTYNNTRGKGYGLLNRSLARANEMFFVLEAIK